MIDYIWLDHYDALVVHERLLALNGGGAGIHDNGLLELEKVIKTLHNPKKSVSKRQFGCMKGLVVSMADDFDAPLSEL